MKLDLKKDRRAVLKYIEKRIKDYSLYENLGPGDDDAPITLLTVSFDAEEDSCLILVFDTRPDADVDGQWKRHIDNETNLCALADWRAAYETLCDDGTVLVTRHGGKTVELGYDDADERFQVEIGNMLTDALTELRDGGALTKLPLAPDAFMVIEEWGGRFYWPTYETRKEVGSVLNPAHPEATSGRVQQATTQPDIDLRKDRSELRKYIEKRIRDYPVYENHGPGEDDAPIRLITLGFYADQGGYVNLVFDTRSKAEVDGEWTLYLDDANTCPFPSWSKACESVYEGKLVSVVRHDGTTIELANSGEDEVMQAIFGDMLVDLLTQMRDDGSLSQLPLHPKAYMVVEEFDGQYFWPTYDTRKSAGRIVK